MNFVHILFFELNLWHRALASCLNTKIRGSGKFCGWLHRRQVSLVKLAPLPLPSPLNTRGVRTGYSGCIRWHPFSNLSGRCGHPLLDFQIQFRKIEFVSGLFALIPAYTTYTWGKLSAKTLSGRKIRKWYLKRAAFLPIFLPRFPEVRHVNLKKRQKAFQ